MVVIRYVSILFLLWFCAGCNRVNKGQFHGDSLTIDGRYSQAIMFDTLRLSIPLAENTYLRVDDPVSDTHEHLRALAHELGIADHGFSFTNPAQRGMQILLRFRDGKSCSVIWAKKQAEAAQMRACLEHEKYHAVCALTPQSIPMISARIAELGFIVNLADHDEEFAATIIEILAIHLQGTPLENISGSKLVVKAVELLKTHRAKATTSPKL